MALNLFVNALNSHAGPTFVFDGGPGPQPYSSCDSHWVYEGTTYPCSHVHVSGHGTRPQLAVFKLWHRHLPLLHDLSTVYLPAADSSLLMVCCMHSQAAFVPC
jgi:hypothetical protein